MADARRRKRHASMCEFAVCLSIWRRRAGGKLNAFTGIHSTYICPKAMPATNVLTAGVLKKCK